MTYKIYLSGPISGLTYDDGNDWRVQTTAELETWEFDRLDNGSYQGRRTSKICCLNPMRAHEFLRSMGKIGDKIGADTEHAFLVTDEFIATRDAWDTMRANACFVNLLGATRVSIGTMLEVGMAHAARVPVILVMEKSGNVHDHPMLRNYATLRFDNLSEAIIATRALFAV